VHVLAGIDGGTQAVCRGPELLVKVIEILLFFAVLRCSYTLEFHCHDVSPQLEHAEQALNRADGDARGGVELVAGQLLDDVFLAKLGVVVGRGVLVKLFFGLPAPTAPVHQKQHAPGPAKPYPVSSGNSRRAPPRAARMLACAMSQTCQPAR
jgi:hypothetical protein